MKSGIVSYGGYIPRYRIRPKDIGTVWGADGEAMGRGLNIRAKSVPGPDEDVITISVEAARACMAKVDIDPTEIGAIYVGSESHPYAVKPTATIVAEAIGSAPVMTAADFEFACKAGTAAIQTSMGLTLSKMMKYSLAIGSDTSQGPPGDALEDSGQAGGAIMVGLCAILDEAEAGDRIFAVGYGSGAGSDAFDLTVTDEITKIRRDATPTIKEMIADHAFVDYATYAKYRGKILMREA